MEQAGLKQKDLVPFIGSRSKVSEVLSRRRPLSIAMIRKLHEGLDIPANVLLGETEKKMTQMSAEIDWDQFPLSDMLKRNWLEFSWKARRSKKSGRRPDRRMGKTAWSRRIAAYPLTSTRKSR